jgi:leucyl aminopeptidase
MQIGFAEALDGSGRALLVGIDNHGRALSALQDKTLLDLLNCAVKLQKSCGRFTGKFGQSVEIITPPGSICRRLVGLCVGRLDDIDQGLLERLGGAAAARLGQLGETEAVIDASGLTNGDIPHAVVHVAFGAALRNYTYTFARTRKPEPSEAVKLTKLTMITPQKAEAEARYSAISGQIKSVHHARDLINTPPNVLYPDSFVDLAQSLVSLGITVEALEPEQLQALGMNALLAVGRGSAFQPRLLALRWNGSKDPDEKPIVFVGKGITFDTGGINLKTPQWMKGMKGDMAGGAAALAAVMSSAEAKLPINIAAVIPLAENAISGSAYRPSDVIVTACGVSIEVMHTDAEGRLALIDAIWYAREKMGAGTIVGVGTITGSGIFGLGRHYAGLYSSDDDLAQRLTRAGSETAEPLWRLPVSEKYDDDLLSGTADYLQMAPFELGADGTYVMRLLRHAAADVPWAQIEMAGLEFAHQDTFICPKGATGFGSRLLGQFATNCAHSLSQEDA